MLPVFADPKTDLVFKRIFGTAERKPLLMALLNDLLELEGDRRIRDLQHAPAEQHLDRRTLKLSIVDVKCTDASGRHFVVEMQVLNVDGFEKRVVYNASKAYVMQLRDGDDYPALCDVIAVTICNFNLWSDKDEQGRDKVPMLSRWRMQEQRSGEKGLPQVQYTFLELPKYTAGSEPKTLVEKWAFFFSEAKNLEVIPPALAEAPFREALEIARRVTFTETEWQAYERAKMAEQDARGTITLARREGHAEGHAEGLTEGVELGELKARRETLLFLLEQVGIPLTEAERARIEACTDAATLKRWIASVLSAKTAAEVLT